MKEFDFNKHYTNISDELLTFLFKKGTLKCTELRRDFVCFPSWEECFGKIFSTLVPRYFVYDFRHYGLWSPESELAFMMVDGIFYPYAKPYGNGAKISGTPIGKKFKANTENFINTITDPKTKKDLLELIHKLPEVTFTWVQYPERELQYVNLKDFHPNGSKDEELFWLYLHYEWALFDLSGNYIGLVDKDQKKYYR